MKCCSTAKCQVAPAHILCATPAHILCASTSVWQRGLVAHFLHVVQKLLCVLWVRGNHVVLVSACVGLLQLLEGHILGCLLVPHAQVEPLHSNLLVQNGKVHVDPRTVELTGEDA